MTNYSDCYEIYEIKELNEENFAYEVSGCAIFDDYRCAVVCLGTDDLPSHDIVSQICNVIDYRARAYRNPFDSSIRISLKNNSEIYFITYSDLGFYENLKFDEILVYEKDKFTSKQLEHLVLKHKNFQQGDENSVLDEFLNSFTTIKM